MPDIRIFEIGDVSNHGTVRPSVFRAKQAVTIGATSAQSAAFNAATLYVTVQTDGDCHVEFGANPAATTGSFKIASGSLADFRVRPGDKLAVIQA